MKWSAISNFGANKIVQRTYIYLFLVPFVVSALEKLGRDELIDAIPFSWQMFFFSALSFSIGSLLYQVFVPQIIKENQDYGDFTRSSRDWSHLESYATQSSVSFNDYCDIAEKHLKVRPEALLDESNFKKVHDLLKPNKRKMFEFMHTNLGDHGFFHYPGINATVEEQKLASERNQRSSDDAMRRRFWRLHDYSDRSRPFIRAMCTVMFLSGSLLLLSIVINATFVVLDFEPFDWFKRAMEFNAKGE